MSLPIWGSGERAVAALSSSRRIEPLDIEFEESHRLRQKVKALGYLGMQFCYDAHHGLADYDSGHPSWTEFLFTAGLIGGLNAQPGED
jgi:hypothetical protein